MTVLDALKRSSLAHRFDSLVLSRYLPILDWLGRYRREDLVGDVLAGIIVTIMLVPQSMAYALLAGLPPQVGLYASIVPLVIYSLFGTSRTLAVGPVAITSLLVAAGLGDLAAPGSAEYVQLALTLALMVGLLRLAMGLVRLGFLVNFLSQPILSGYTSAAAIIIALSQFKHLLGLKMPNIEEFGQLLAYLVAHAAETNPVTLTIGLGSVAILLYFSYRLSRHLEQWGVPPSLRLPLVKSAPLVMVLLGTVVVATFHLDQAAGVKVVGQVPAGLPGVSWPLFYFQAWRTLLPTALVISFVGYMESISVAKSLASRRRQKVDANQELIALGAANLGAAFTGGYPVNGGFSRSVVNFNAGANTGLASLITAGLIALTVIFLTPLFHFLPQAVLAAIIIVSVTSLIDVAALKHVWRYNQADAAALVITFLAVLAFGVQIGIGVGVASTILLFLWRTSRPHVAIVGRLGDSETYRNIRRHPVKTCPHVVAIRVDESLYFANTKFLEDTVLQTMADQPQVKHLVLIGIAINFIDASALETLESLVQELGSAGVEFHLADIKGPVMDRLKAIGFIDKIGLDHVHLSTHDAMIALRCV